MARKEASHGQASGRGRRIAVGTLLAVATLLTFHAVFSVWINRQALNTDNWVDTSDRLLQNEEVQAQLSNYMANFFQDERLMIIGGGGLVWMGLGAFIMAKMVNFEI